VAAFVPAATSGTIDDKDHIEVCGANLIMSDFLEENG